MSSPNQSSTQVPALRYRPDVPADQAVIDALDVRLQGLCLIDTPAWVYDPERCQFLWANTPALEMWRSPGIDELRSRDIASSQSEAMYSLALDYLRRTQAGEPLKEWVTLELGGVRRRYSYRFHGLSLADGRAVLLMEARTAPTAEELLAFASDYTLTVGLFELDGRLVSANPAFLELAEHHLLENLNALLAGDSMARDWPARMAEQALHVFETRIATHAGERPFRGELRGVLSQSGQPRALLTLQDLTKQRIREAEQALRESETRTAQFLERAGVATYACDLPAGQGNADQRWWDMLGYAPGDCPNSLEHWATMIHPDDAPQVLADWARLTAGERLQWTHEYRLRCKDGSYRWILDRGLVTQTDETGVPTEIIGIGLDIHERKQMEAALAQSEFRQRALLGALPDLIVVHDKDGRFVDVHAARIEDWSLPTSDLVGRTATETLPPTPLAEFEAVQPEVLRTGRPSNGSFSIEHPQRGTCYREFTMVPYGESQTLTVIRDVTARYLAEQQGRLALRQAQQAQKMEALGQLTAGVAHDFNNILAGILGYTWLARQLPVVAADPKASDYLKVIATAGERGRDLVQKLMVFSRRGEPRTVEAIDPLPVIEEGFRMLKAVIPTRLTLNLELPASAPAVAVDPVDLQQVLTNLVVNSRDAVGGDGTITVTLGIRKAQDTHCTSCLSPIPSEMLALVVRDTGTGIPANVLGRIFDPFFTTKEVGSGTGIGLSMVDGIVHRAGGHVVVNSQPLSGTQFEILLPVSGAGLPAAEPVPGEETQWRPGRGRLMVVDDEALVSAFLRELLEDMGYVVDTFANGPEALGALDTTGEPYAALITDLTMPLMTGLELASIVSSRVPSLPIVLCTGASEPPVADALLRAGIHRVLPKPVPVAELKDVLAELLPT